MDNVFCYRRIHLDLLYYQADRRSNAAWFSYALLLCQISLLHWFLYKPNMALDEIQYDSRVKAWFFCNEWCLDVKAEARKRMCFKCFPTGTWTRKEKTWYVYWSGQKCRSRIGWENEDQRGDKITDWSFIAEDKLYTYMYDKEYQKHSHLYAKKKQQSEGDERRKKYPNEK